MLEQLLQFDQFIFKIIHFEWSNQVFDLVLPILREKLIWIPFYLAIIIWAFFKMSYRSASLFILSIIILVSLADFISSQVIKKTVQRERPCQLAHMPSTDYELVPCGGGFSFPSSHATNHFALAFFLIFSLGKKYRRIHFPLLTWAIMISLSQIYVGLHFPTDVIAGAILGFIMAFLVWQLFKIMILEKNPLY